jgi:carbon-monoxide dehydrogenase medium subunit
MKPVKFEYRAPSKLADALELLAEVGEDGKVLAGGQSLVPSMNFRLARPSFIVDINGLVNLTYVDASGESVRIGALTRHSMFEAPAVVAGPLGALLSRAARHVGHLPIRVRGTFGGSIAHADPAAEWCMLATLLDATMIATGQTGEREIGAREFFKTVFTTALEPTELLTEIRLPKLAETSRVGFVEFSRRAGDFAIVAAATVLDMTDGNISGARVALGGVGGTPVRAPGAERVLAGNAPSQEVFRAAADAAGSEVEPIADIHGDAEYRRDLVRVLTRRALEQTADGL